MDKWERARGSAIIPHLAFFTKSYRIDVPAQQTCIRHVLANNPGGIFLLSSTGEGPFIHQKEEAEQELIRVVTAEVPPDILLCIGCFGERVPEVLEDMRAKSKYPSIDAFVVTPPRSSSIHSSPLTDFLLTIADQSPKPVFLYNNPPAFAGNEISLAAMENFAQHKNIIGIKDSSPSLHYKVECTKWTSEQFSVYTGKEGELGSLLRQTQKHLRQYVGVVPSLGNITNIFPKMLQKRGEDDYLKEQEINLNSWRRDFHELTIQEGKAQRGLKVAFELLYPEKIQPQPIVQPGFSLDAPPEFRNRLKKRLDLISSKNLITKFEG